MLHHVDPIGPRAHRSPWQYEQAYLGTACALRGCKTTPMPRLVVNSANAIASCLIGSLLASFGAAFVVRLDAPTENDHAARRAVGPAPAAVAPAVRAGEVWSLGARDPLGNERAHAHARCKQAQGQNQAL